MAGTDARREKDEYRGYSTKDIQPTSNGLGSYQLHSTASRVSGTGFQTRHSWC